MKSVKDIEKTYVLCIPNKNDAAQLKDTGLIYIHSISEGTNFAGYLIDFTPICGNYETSVKDIKYTIDKAYGIIGYSQMDQILSRIDNKIEKFLND